MQHSNTQTDVHEPTEKDAILNKTKTQLQEALAEINKLKAIIDSYEAHNDPDNSNLIEDNSPHINEPLPLTFEEQLNHNTAQIQQILQVISSFQSSPPPVYHPYMFSPTHPGPFFMAENTDNQQYNSHR